MLPRIVRLSRCSAKRCFVMERFNSNSGDSDAEPVWKDPWKHALPKQSKTLTEYEEIKIDWNYVERLMPHRIVPDVPHHSSYPTPSGWRPPNPSGKLPYYVRRLRNHMLPLYLQTRRDQLDPSTMDFNYVELVIMKNIRGDVFACERDLKEFLEREVGHPVATHVDELKGTIKVKGADRTLVEKFLFEAGF